MTQIQGAPNRVSGLPSEPTFVFSSFWQNDARRGVLSSLVVPAVMESFQYIRGTSDSVFEYLSWPTRRYLDSGIFTLMSRAGTTQVASVAKKRKDEDFRATVDQLLADYVAYLKEHGKDWDHVVEIDADNLPGLGSAYTLEAREQLLDVVGSRLLPVWHNASESDSSKALSSWKRLIRQFPYVAIGGDVNRDRRLYRRMVELAHAEGVIVHGLASTNLNDFKEIGWDTGDSTAWVSGVRFGNFAGLKVGKKMNISAVSRARAATSQLAALDIDVDQLLAKGGTFAKFYYSAVRQLELQQEIRDWNAARQRRASSV